MSLNPLVFSIEFDRVSHPSQPLQRGTDLELGVDAHISIADAGGVMFEEPMFAIVELRSALKAWLETGANAAFHFVSVEAEDDPLIYFQPVEHGWEIGSPWSDRVGTATGGELIAASKGFIAGVDGWVLDHLAVEDVDAYLRGRPA